MRDQREVRYKIFMKLLFIPGFSDPQYVDFIRRDPRQYPISDQLVGRIDGAIATLTPREQFVINYRNGLRDGHYKSLRETAKHVYNLVTITDGVSPQRVRQIENRAVRKLRHPSRLSKIVEAVEDKSIIPDSLIDRLQKWNLT